MPGNKKDFGSMLRGQKPLVKGPPVQLSTETPAPPPTEESAQTHKSVNAQEHKETKPQLKRISQGLRLRSDLLRSMKRIAFDEERHLYEVMEEAMAEYIERRKDGSSNNNEQNASSQHTPDDNSHATLRIKTNYEIQEDYVRAFKVMAVDERRKIYQLLEDAMKDFLVKRGKITPEQSLEIIGVPSNLLELTNGKHSLNRLIFNA